MDTNSIKQKTAVATRWSALSEIIAKCITPITNMILARLLTPEAFGVVATVTMIVSFADMFTDAGFQKYLIQHDFENTEILDKHTDVAFWTNLVISVILWMMICIYSTSITQMVGNPGLESVVIVASASLPLTSFSSIQMARFKRDFKFKELLPIRMASVIIPFLVTVPLAIALRSYWALIISTLVGNVTNAILLTFKSKWKPTLYYSFSILKEMFLYSWWILLESISIWATTYIDTLIVGLYLSTYYVGVYKTAMMTVNQIMGLITAATSIPLFAALSRLKGNKRELENTYLDYVQAVSYLVIPLGIGIYIYRDLVVYILLGSQWGDAVSFVGLWGCVYAFTIVLGSYCNGLYNAMGKTYLSFASQILQLVVLVPAVFYSAQYGYRALYITRSIARLEIIVVQLVLMKVFMEIKIFKQLETIIPALIGSIVMTICAFCLQHISQNPIWSMISVLICCVVYFAVMAIFFKAKLFLALELLGIKRIIVKDVEK